MSLGLESIRFDEPGSLQKVADRVVDLHDTWRQWMDSNYYRKWVYYYRVYFGYQEKNPIDPYRSNLFLREVTAQIDASVPRHIQAMYSTDPAFHALPDNGPPESEIMGEIIENVVHRYWIQGGRREVSVSTVYNAHITGIGWEKSQWLFDQADDGRILRDLPVQRSVSPFNVLFDGTKDCIDDTWIIHRRMMRRSELDAMNDDGANLDLEGIQSSEFDMYDLDALYHAQGKTGPMSNDEIKADMGRDPWHLILEFHNDEYTCLVDHASKTVLAARTQLIGKKPWCVARYKPIPGMMIGIGMAELLAPLNEAMNNVERAYQDNIVHSVHKRWAAFRDSGVDMQDWVPAPNKPLLLKRPSANAKIDDELKDMSGGNPYQGGREAQDRWQQRMENYTGQSTMVLGGDPGRQELVGTSAMKSQMANMRQYLENTRWGEELIARSAELHFRMIMRFMEQHVQMRVEGRRVPVDVLKLQFADIMQESKVDGKPMMEVSPDMFEGLQPSHFRFVATGSAGQAVREYVLQQSMQLQTLFVQSPIVGAQAMQFLPGMTPEAIALHADLEQSIILQSEVSGKERLLLNHSRAVQGAVNAQAMMLQQQQMMAAQQQGQPPQEGQPMPEEQAPPPDQGMMMQ